MGTSALVRVVGRLWWTAARRRWRQETGALFILLGFVLFLGYFTARAPAGGEALYGSVLWGIGIIALSLLPLLFPGESVLATPRFHLLPISTGRLWLLRLLFANPLRTALALALLLWGVAAVLAWELSPIAALLETTQLVGATVAAAVVAQIVEEVLRRHSSVFLYQIVLLVGVASWPPLVDFLRDRSQFVPPPAWASGTAAPLLLGGGAALSEEVVFAALAIGAAGAALLIGQALLARWARTPAPLPRVPRVTGPTARAVGRLVPRAPAAFTKEIALLLRFVFVRIALVFSALWSAGAVLTAMPWLLLSLPLWWQPLCTNLLGPDLPDGIQRYRLTGMPLRRVLVLRHAAVVFLATTIAVGSALLAAAFGGLPLPDTGPPTRWMYPVALLYGVSLILLLTLSGDRYGLRFRDPIGMRVLIPTRTGSGGAEAGLLLLLAWAVTAAVAAGIWFGWMTLLRLLAPTLSEGERIAASMVLAAGIHLLLYRVSIAAHARAGR